MTTLLSLPSDISTLIIRFIHVRPRLLIVSRVSRRLRDIVLASIVSLPEERGLCTGEDVIPPNYALFPNLRSVLFTAQVHNNVLDSPYLSRVRSLRVKTLRPAATALPFSSLTLLHFRPSFQTPAQLIIQNSSSLTELRFQPEEYMKNLDEMQKLDMPQLRSLSMMTFSPSAIFAPWLSSLTELSFAPIGRALDSLHPAPHLRTLEVKFTDNKRLDQLVAWILSLPSLTSLSVIAFSFPEKLWFLLGATRALTALTTGPPIRDIAPRFRQCMTSCVNFRRLTCSTSLIGIDALLPESWARLTYFSAHQMNDIQVEDLLKSCPKLATLKIWKLMLTKLAPPFASTSLRQVSLKLAQDKADAHTMPLQIAFLAHALRCFPMLQEMKMEFTVDEADITAVDARFEALLQEIETSGRCILLRLSSVAAIRRHLAAVAQRHPWVNSVHLSTNMKP